MARTAFDDFFDEQMADPARAEAYREARTEIDTYDRFMRTINALRESSGDSKATLASMSGLPAQSIRKMLTDKKANPTIATVFKMLSTMGFRAASRTAQGPARAPAGGAPHARSETTAGARLRGLSACSGRRRLRLLDAPQNCGLRTRCRAPAP